VLDLTTKDLYQNHWSFTGKNVPGANSKDEKVYLPGKNLLLISKAAVFCALKKIPNLALGPLQSNPFPDARPEFFKAMEKALGKGLGFSIKIHVPFLKCSKTQVMSLGRDLPLHLTFSCLAPKKTAHCGRCNKCAERKKAFLTSEIPDFTHYAN
jgi:7-cyano-7-deazaguanine synthase